MELLTHYMKAMYSKLSYTIVVSCGPSQDHSRALRAAISRLPADWRRPPGRPRRTWVRTIELDLQQHNLCLNSEAAEPRGPGGQLTPTFSVTGST